MIWVILFLCTFVISTSHRYNSYENIQIGTKEYYETNVSRQKSQAYSLSDDAFFLFTSLCFIVRIIPKALQRLPVLFRLRGACWVPVVRCGLRVSLYFTMWLYRDILRCYDLSWESNCDPLPCRRGTRYKMTTCVTFQLWTYDNAWNEKRSRHIYLTHSFYVNTYNRNDSRLSKIKLSSNPNLVHQANLKIQTKLRINKYPIGPHTLATNTYINNVAVFSLQLRFDKAFSFLSTVLITLPSVF